MLRLLLASLLVAAAGCRQPSAEQIEANGFGQRTFSSQSLSCNDPRPDELQPWAR